MSWTGAVAIALMLTSTSAKAVLIGGVDFGVAGPSNWGILALGGAGAAGFGTQGTDVSINGPGAGVYGTVTQSNVGIADAGKANFSSATPTPTIDGKLFLSTNATSNISQPFIISGGTVKDASSDALLASAAAAAASGLATANGLACTGTLCSITLLDSTQTIAPVNPGGQNVLQVSSINLGNGEIVTLGGPAGTDWVIIVSGDPE